MWDEEHDRQMMRNQMRAILLLMVLMMAYYFWFIPQTPVVTPPPDAHDGPVATDRPGQPAMGPGAEVLETIRADAPGEWPYLPPPVETENSDDEVTISDADLVLTFTRVGARLKSATLRLGKDGEDSVQLVPDIDGPQVYPFELEFTDERIGTALNSRRFDAMVDRSGKEVTFVLELPDAAVIRKHFSLSENPHVLDVRVDYESRQNEPVVLGMDAIPAYALTWGPGVKTDEEDRTVSPALIWRRDNENKTLSISDLAGRGQEQIPFIDWFGYKSKYFLVAFKPEFEQTSAVASESNGVLQFGLTAPRFEARPGSVNSNEFRVYIGPMELASLEKAWDTLPTALTFFTMFQTMDWFAKLLLSILHWFYENTFANYGVAIIFLTILVRTVMLPLTLKSMRSMKRMQALAPEMEQLREKHKEDQQELSRAMMELYRERGVNPLGGCFPMLLQMPIFIALYRMLWNAFELRGAPFLWVKDLSGPDCLIHLPFLTHVPVVGKYIACFNLLPILMGAAMVVSMKIMPTAGIQNPQQKMMMTLMPIIFSVFCYPLAAGLNLYVLTSTVLGIVQQSLIRASGPAEKPEPIKKRQSARKKKPKNVWARAQEVKRQHKKEAKRRQAEDAKRRQAEDFKQKRQKSVPGGSESSERENGKPSNKDQGKRKGKAPR